MEKTDAQREAAFKARVRAMNDEELRLQIRKELRQILFEDRLQVPSLGLRYCQCLSCAEHLTQRQREEGSRFRSIPTRYGLNRRFYIENVRAPDF